MVGFEGNFFYQTIVVLIDPQVTLSYVSPNIVDECCLQATMFTSPWLVQLATRAKEHLLAKVSNCALKIVGQSLVVDLNVLPIVSYEILIGMD